MFTYTEQDFHRYHQFLGTAMLLLTICAATDKRKGPAPAERVPIALFIVLLGVSVSIGAQTGKHGFLLASLRHSYEYYLRRLRAQPCS